jgi:hypothetical protein
MSLTENTTVTAIIICLMLITLAPEPFGKSDLYSSFGQMFRGQTRRDENPQQLSSALLSRKDDVSEYEIIITIDETWNKSSIPIPLKVTLRNNSYDMIRLRGSCFGSVNELIIKDSKGVIVPQVKERKMKQHYHEFPDEDTIIVKEANCGSIAIKPGEEFSYSVSIGEDYKLRLHEEYVLVNRRTIFLGSSQTKIDLTSSPLKLVINSLEE